MEDAPVIAGLLSKRASIEGEIAELEREIRRRRAEVMQIDATILLFRPDLKRAKRDVTRFQRSAHFVTGELTRRCQTALREAKGTPITADATAIEAMREKKLDLGDCELRMDFARRFLWTLNRMLGGGAVTKQGWGGEAKWALPLTGLSSSDASHSKLL